jgi:predicted nucleotidyltransferase
MPAPESPLQRAIGDTPATGTQFVPRSEHGKVLAANRDAVIALVHEHGMSNVRVFGSTARGTDRPDSDIDLLVDIGPKVTLFTLAGLEIELQRILGVDIDLVQADAIKPRLEDKILRDAVAL